MLINLELISLDTGGYSDKSEYGIVILMFRLKCNRLMGLFGHA